ncbi:unnamed protein product [Cuscuta epithymum]|uniref:Fibronectin type III-like domain-containing protein n=1 Tax=Cuscuta epithymum TaxID=186058 RepID=A0AAV0FQ24_9ASTE|nr:unnamed protein product [Cuscuta epithymum]
MKLHSSVLLSALLCLTSLQISSSQPAQPLYSCDQRTESFRFCQTNLSISFRVKDLVSRLTLDEKIAQLVSSAPAIPRLGIPAFEWWSEALHGVADTGKGISFAGKIKAATSFPQVILTAASFDEYLWYRIGQVIGREARALYNVGQAKGLTFWAPNINIFRDPRWGRGQETPGEDPEVTGKYAVAYVRGVQGDTFQGGKTGNHLQASACCKHFAAYDMENWNGNLRYGFNAIVTEQDLADTYQPPFQNCIQKAQASGIMCAYNSVNGVPGCASYNFLTKTARRQWGFRGYITSDCDAVGNVFKDHKYTKTPEETVADVLNAGMDVNCGSFLSQYTKSAVTQKRVSENQIDRALHNLFSIRMRLGLFDGSLKQLPYGNILLNEVCSQEHQILALQAARNGIVLLKNNAKLLPLSKTKTASLAVIGPNGNNANVLKGNYYGPGCISVEIYKAMQSYVKYASFLEGCNNGVSCTSATIDEAVKLAKNSDQVVLVMGLDQSQEREAADRVHLELPGMQELLITNVAKAAKKPVILVLLCGGPVDITFAKFDPKIGSILWAGYPGEAGGLALAETIFGDHNPGGRLPMTWYPKDYIKVPMTDMRMRADRSRGYPGRTYRFYYGPTVFKFGYGLSYTTYSYEFSSTTTLVNLNQLSSVKTYAGFDSVHYLSVDEIDKETCEKAKFPVTVRVQNSWEMDGVHPVLLFIKPTTEKDGSPMKQLVGFQSVKLKAGEKDELQFELNPCQHLSTANKDGLMVIEQGSRHLVVGNTEHAINVVF